MCVYRVCVCTRAEVNLSKTILHTRRKTAQSPHRSIAFPITLFSPTAAARRRVHLLTRNYKSCYVLDVMHLKNSETKVCHRPRTNHIRISPGNDGSLTSKLNLLLSFIRPIFFYNGLKNITKP